MPTAQKRKTCQLTTHRPRIIRTFRSTRSKVLASTASSKLNVLKIIKKRFFFTTKCVCFLTIFARYYQLNVSFFKKTRQGDNLLENLWNRYRPNNMTLVSANFDNLSNNNNF